MEIEESKDFDAEVLKTPTFNLQKFTFAEEYDDDPDCTPTIACRNFVDSDEEMMCETPMINRVGLGKKGKLGARKMNNYSSSSEGESDSEDKVRKFLA